MLTTCLEVLPAEVVRSRPQLCIYRAWTLYLTSQVSEAERWLQDGEYQLRVQEYANSTNIPSPSMDDLRGEIYAIRSLVAVELNDMERALDYYQQANELLASTSYLYGILKYTMGCVLSSLGDEDAACRHLEEAIRASKDVGNDLNIARCYVALACLQMSCGQMRRAGATCRQALKYASTSPTGQVLLTGAACFSLYELHYEWNNLEEAQFYFDKAIEYAKRAGDVPLERLAYLIQPNLLFAQGQREQGLQLFEEEYQYMQATPRNRVSAIAQEIRVRFWLEAGDIASAVRWERMYVPDLEDERDPLYAIEQMTLARVYLAQGKADEALRTTERPLEIAKRTGRIYSVLSGMSLQALALQAQHATHQALTTLTEALTLAEPEGMIRVFADYGEPMAELLILLLERQQGGNHNGDQPRPMQEYLFKLLSALNIPIITQAQQPQLALVSTREKEVLSLIADGFSTREIATHLIISEGTVKTHMKRIYAKLEVRSRTQAIMRARIRGLL